MAPAASVHESGGGKIAMHAIGCRRLAEGHEARPHPAERAHSAECRPHRHAKQSFGPRAREREWIREVRGIDGQLRFEPEHPSRTPASASADAEVIAVELTQSRRRDMAADLEAARLC